MITWAILILEDYGSNFDRVGLEVEIQVQMSRMELEVQVWTEDLEVVNLLHFQL